MLSFHFILTMLVACTWAVTFRITGNMVGTKVVLNTGDFIKIRIQRHTPPIPMCYKLALTETSSASAKRGYIYDEINCKTYRSTGASATDIELTKMVNMFQSIQVTPPMKDFAAVIYVSKVKKKVSTDIDMTGDILKQLLEHITATVVHPSGKLREISRRSSEEKVAIDSTVELERLKTVPLGECRGPPSEGLVDAPFRIIDYTAAQLEKTGRFAKALGIASLSKKIYDSTESYQLELTEFIQKTNRDMIDELFAEKFKREGRPGKIITHKIKFGFESEPIEAAKHRFGTVVDKEFKTENCLRLGEPATFNGFADALHFGLSPEGKHTKLNYVITNIGGETPEEARFVWRFMHTTGKILSDSRAKHWILNEENRGSPLLSAGEMILYARKEYLHPFTPVTLLMDACSGTYKPNISDEMEYLIGEIFGFHRTYSDLVFNDKEGKGIFKYTTLTPREGHEKHGIFSIILIREALGEEKKGKGNCIRKWIEYFGIEMAK